MRRHVITVLGALGIAMVTQLTSASIASARHAACPDSNPPNEIVLESGSGQTVQLGLPFQTNFQVKLANDNGCPVTGNLAGVNVTFDGPASGPSGIFSGGGWREATVGTDANGVATAPTFTANFTAGAYTVYAHSLWNDVQFSVVNTANGVASSINAAGGSDQAAIASRQYRQPLQARVLDASGQPVQGATVSFSILVGATGASAVFPEGVQAEAATNSSGTAISPPLLANSIAGRFTALATVDGVATVATFVLENHAASQTLAAPKLPQSTARVGHAFRSPLRVRVMDAYGQPIEGQAVTFVLGTQSVGGSGASDPGATFPDGTNQASVVTNAAGWATSPKFRANHVVGTFIATAAAGSSARHFDLHNQADRAASIAVGAASGETTQISTRFAVPLAVIVYDRFGNRVSAATVVFSAPRRGATGYFSISSRRSTAKRHRRDSPAAVAKTNAEGIAVAPPLVANKVVGGYLVHVAVSGTNAHATFALVNAPSP